MNCRVEPLDAHTWRIEEISAPCDSYMYLLEGSERAILIDTAYGRLNLPELLTSLTKLPVEVVCTHYHSDHVGGNPYFSRVYLHEADRELYPLSRRRYENDDRGALWNGTDDSNMEYITDGMQFDLGGRTLRVIHTPGHSPGCICLLDVEHRRLFTGDTCCRADVLLNSVGSTSMEVYAESIRKLQALRSEFDITWPGHHGKPVEPQILDRFSQALTLIGQGEQGFLTDTSHGLAHKFLYEDIGIIWPLSADEREEN